MPNNQKPLVGQNPVPKYVVPGVGASVTVSNPATGQPSDTLAVGNVEDTGEVFEVMTEDTGQQILAELRKINLFLSMIAEDL